MKITVVGAGYVGLSLSVLISIYNEVVIHDIDRSKVESINNKKSPIYDPEINKILTQQELNLSATTDFNLAHRESDVVIVCTPTNYDEETNEFDVSAVESVIKKSLDLNRENIILIKSTVPVGFTENMKKKYNKSEIIFSPEFLREGHAIEDNLNPSRIIIGGHGKSANLVKSILSQISDDAYSPKIEFMLPDEAEAVKLFSNTYLAMRIAFFNELDSFCESKKYDSKKVIEGIGYDPRIGNYYNNPSFGYGGYCLPKDTQQLLANYKLVPNNLIKAIVDANTTRKDFIASQIIKKSPKSVGIYRLVMKEGSDNIRESAVQGIMKRIKSKGIEVIVYEPLIKDNSFFGSKVYKDLKHFVENSDIIIANRFDKEIEPFKEKVYSRDLFYIN